jgi:hypothetical protein
MNDNNVMLHPKREAMKQTSIADAKAKQEAVELTILGLIESQSDKDRQNTMVEPWTSTHNKVDSSDRSLMDFSHRKYDEIHIKRDFTKTQL